MTEKKKFKRKVPEYWWDFRHYPNGDMTIILETTDIRCPSGVIEETPILPKGDCTPIIDAVQKKIDRYKNGQLKI